MPINRYKKSFSSYLKLERALSKNSIEAYLYDLELLNAYLRKKTNVKSIQNIDENILKKFILILLIL